jgi:hypothetical protein
MKPTLYWNIHHEVLLETTTEPIENRIAYIKSSKRLSEQRVRLLCLVKVKAPSKLPKTVVKACADCDKARADYYKARADYYKAYADYDKACADCDKACADYVKACADYFPQLLHRHNLEYPHLAKYIDERGHLKFDVE